MCILAEQVFRSTYFCCWKHIAVDSEFFVLSILEKYHQISLDGPVYVYKFSFFNTSNTYRVFGNYFRPR